MKAEFHVGQRVSVRGAAALRGKIINTTLFGEKLIHLVLLTNGERRWMHATDIESTAAIDELADIGDTV